MRIIDQGKGENLMARILFVLIGVVCVIYGFMVRAVGSGTGFFIVWLGLGIVSLAQAVLLHIGFWKRVSGKVKKCLLVLVSLVALSFVIVEGCVLSQFTASGEENLDYIMVLGAQVYENGPSTVLKFRLDKAIAYLYDNPDTLCIVSGGQGSNEPFPEAEGMADYLRKNGIPEDRILIEDQSGTTEENFAFSKEFIEEGASVGVVTNNFHVFRALQIAKSQGLTNICGIAAKTTPLYLPSNMVREYFGEIKYLIRSL